MTRRKLLEPLSLLAALPGLIQSTGPGPGQPTPICGLWILNETYKITGKRVSFTLARGSTAKAGSVLAYKNGVRMEPSGDYTVSSNGTVNFNGVNIPEAGDTIQFDYMVS